MMTWYYINKISKLSLKDITKKMKRRYLGNWLYHKPVLKYLRHNYLSTCEEVISRPEVYNETKDFYVWVMWWQGEQKMPEIINICYHSIIAVSEGCKLCLITKENVGKYLNIPIHIWKKYEQGIIPIAQLSDIIRFGLLSRYGGIWIDSTTLITNYNLIKLRNQFFTLKFKTRSQSTPTMGRWSITVLAGNQGCILYKTMYHILIEYWRKENYLLKYFLTDYFILLLYNEFPQIKDLIDKVEWSDSNYTLRKHINKKYNQNFWNTLIRNTYFHTLSRKERYSEMINNSFTFYGYLKKNLI